MLYSTCAYVLSIVTFWKQKIVGLLHLVNNSFWHNFCQVYRLDLALKNFNALHFSPF